MYETSKRKDPEHRVSNKTKLVTRVNAGVAGLRLLFNTIVMNKT